MAKFWPTKGIRQIQGGPVTQTVVGSTSANQYLGATLITSRDTFVGAPLVTATSRIFLQPLWLGPSSYGSAVTFTVACLQAGSGFFISTINSIGFGAASTASVSVQWELKHYRTP